MTTSVRKEEEQGTTNEIGKEAQDDRRTQPEGSAPIETYADSAPGTKLPEDKTIEGVLVEAGAKIISDEDDLDDDNDGVADVDEGAQPPSSTCNYCPCF